MKAFQIEITCTMDDGRELVAHVDQRDHAAFEGTEMYAQNPPISSATKTRWLAWNALTRTRQISWPWGAFNLEQCAGAIVTDWPGKDAEESDTEQEGEQEPDPSRS